MNCTFWRKVSKKVLVSIYHRSRCPKRSLLSNQNVSRTHRKRVFWQTFVEQKQFRLTNNRTSDCNSLLINGTTRHSTTWLLKFSEPSMSKIKSQSNLFLAARQLRTALAHQRCIFVWNCFFFFCHSYKLMRFVCVALANLATIRWTRHNLLSDTRWRSNNNAIFITPKQTQFQHTSASVA